MKKFCLSFIMFMLMFTSIVNANTFDIDIFVIEEILNFLFNIIAVVFCVIMIIALLPKFEKIKISLKQRIALLTAPYYRDIPCEGDWDKIFYISYVTKMLRRKTDFIGALILKWIKNGSISIVNENKTYIIFNVEPEKFSGDTYEHKLYSALYKEAQCFDFNKTLKNRKSSTTIVEALESKKLKRWCRINRDIIFEGMENIITTWQGKLVNVKTLKRVRKCRFIKIYHIFPTEKFLEDAIKIAGLKKYLKSYTLIKERETIEVKLFEDYLIFAQVLGDATRVIKEFKVFYPEIIKRSPYQNVDNIKLGRSSIRKGVVNAKIVRGIDKIVNYGGNGFSFGGGGRGSFGGSSRGGGGFR